MLVKLHGRIRGGTVAAIKKQLSVPVKLICLGEGLWPGARICHVHRVHGVQFSHQNVGVSLQSGRRPSVRLG